MGRTKTPHRFKRFDRSELVAAISALRIDRVGDEVITSYSGRVLRTKRVSKRYEVFDIADYMVRNIDRITSNFPVTQYSLSITGGTQYLVLASDPVEFGGSSCRKCFFILNSSDCTRSLSIRMGLCLDEGLFVIPKVHNIRVGRRHIRGITADAEVASAAMGGETFEEQVRAISSLMGERVMLGRVRRLLVGDDGRGHARFDALRSALVSGGSLGPAEAAALSSMPPSHSAGDELPADLHLDAYLVFTAYMSTHFGCDSHVVARETERIMRMTSSFVRRSRIEQALSD
jgi:hypothetical protein